MNYIEINLSISPKNPWTDIITQELATIGFDSFMEENDNLLAYVSEENFNKTEFQKLITDFLKKEIQINYTETFIPETNWNQVWESDYPQVEIDKDILIRAPFHPVNPEFKLNIEIQPQMSFGTGHHQTTYLLCKSLLKIDLKEKSVLDVGTGTGILGIVASKLGASSVLGTDIEEGAVENTMENIERNLVSNFTVLKGDIEVVPSQKFDVILANINKNVLLNHLESYGKLIAKSGLLLMSGFFETDISSLENAAKRYNFTTLEILTKEDWAVMKLQYRG